MNLKLASHFFSHTKFIENIGQNAYITHTFSNIMGTYDVSVTTYDDSKEACDWRVATRESPSPSSYLVMQGAHFPSVDQVKGILNRGRA